VGKNLVVEGGGLGVDGPRDGSQKGLDGGGDGI